MNYIMGLEGQQTRVLDGLRGELYGKLPRPIWRARAALDGPIEVASSHKLLIVAGVLLGMWLSASTPGKKLVSKYVKRK
jgi:hypothetical protein